jgi:hypothetical protein
MMSIGRLYEVVETLKCHYNKEFYVDLFNNFLDEHHHIKDVLLDDTFFSDLKSLVEKEIFGSKRHSGSISFEDTQDARKKIMWNFENTNCLFLKLLDIGRTF